MLFNTPQYIMFLLVVVFIYYMVPQKIRYIWLLIVSYFFYMQWNCTYILLLFFCTMLTYFGARIIEGSDRDKTLTDKAEKKRKICLVMCIILNLSILFFYKYFEFGIGHLNRILHLFDISEISWNYRIILPIGISFYMLQALGYLIDVYRRDIRAEKNFFRYALFISFFPQLVAGPIERSKNLLVQLRETHTFEYENLRKGFWIILYGLFLKMVIADRAAIIVDVVYANSKEYPGFYIIIATFLFAIQIYCDFYGYSTIARGSALLMGFKLMDNFDAPYYARSVKEFWRRWHISLSGWFRDYLYIPLGGSRSGKIKKESNLLIVFAVSGLWHGASLSYVFWGVLNGGYQVLRDIIVEGACFLKRFKEKYNIVAEHENKREDISDCLSKRLFQRGVTFLLVTFAWLFFRAGGLNNAFEIIHNLFGANNWTILFDGSLYNLGVTKNYMNVLVGSIAILSFVDICKYHKKDILGLVLQQGLFFRLFIILLLLFAILLYGCYGEMYDIQQFIYFQF